MSGEGTGGGGALALLLALWIGATAFVVGQGIFDEEPGVAGDPGGVTSAAGDGVEAVGALACRSVADCQAIITRADLARMIARVFDLPMTTVDHFDDDDGLSDEAFINRLAAAGLVGGCDDRAFCPDRVVSRGQLARLVAGVLDLPAADEAPFSDVTGSGAAADAINRLAAAGVVQGCAPDAFCPSRLVTRGELNAILGRALDMVERVG